MIYFLVSILCMPIQLLGYVTTCTQGASGSFLTGATYSAPLLLLSLIVLTRKLNQKDDLNAPWWLIPTACLLLLTLVLTRDIWFDTLVYGSPCGPDYVGSPVTIGNGAIITIAYLALPLANVGFCMWLLVRQAIRIKNI